LAATGAGSVICDVRATARAPDMTVTKGIKEIRDLLDALPEKKTDKDRLLVLFKIKVLVECIEEPIKERSDEEKAAYAAKTRIIKKALKQFLTALDKINVKHEELGDTAVRDKMFDAILKGFIKPEKAYRLPMRFGMFEEPANILVRSAIQTFLSHPDVIEARGLLSTPDERLNAFQDDDVETSEQTTVFEYFGYRNKPVA
jgi:hypothetical protein